MGEDIQEYKVAGMRAGQEVGMGENMAAGKVILTQNRPFEIMSSVSNVWSPPSEDTVHISCMMEMIANIIMPLYCLKDNCRTLTITLPFLPSLLDLFNNKRFVPLN